MVKVGYCFPFEIGGLLEDSRITRCSIKDLYGFTASSKDLFQRCPATQEYIKNTFLINPSRHEQIIIKGYDPKNDHFQLSGSFEPEPDEFGFRYIEDDRVMVQMRGMSVFFFTDTPDVKAVVQGTIQTNRSVVRGCINVSDFPRTVHPAFHCRIGDEIQLDPKMPELSVTFITPNAEPVSLVPCSIPQIYRVTSELEAYNIRRKKFGWREFFLRAKKLRMKDQVERYRLGKDEF